MRRSLTRLLRCGIDEAGRGCVIGPMVAAAVTIDCDATVEELREAGVRDSKDLSMKKRESLFKLIMKAADHVNYVAVSAADIDRRRASGENLNEIEYASVVSLMGSALDALSENNVTFYVDSWDVNPERLAKNLSASLECDHGPFHVVAEHRADSSHICVAAASIIAKVVRDEALVQIERDIGAKLGSGYPADPVTSQYLASCNGVFPDTVRHSWSTVRKLARNRQSGPKYQGTLNADDKNTRKRRWQRSIATPRFSFHDDDVIMK